MELDGPNKVANSNGLLRIWPFIQAEANVEIKGDNVNMAPLESDQDAPKALRLRVLVVASNNELRESQDRFTSMVGESPGFSWLSHPLNVIFQRISDSRGGRRAKPVPAKRPGAPPRLVEREAHQVRLSETKQPWFLLFLHFVQISPKLCARQGDVVEADLQPLWRLPKQARGLLASQTFTQRMVRWEGTPSQLDQQRHH